MWERFPKDEGKPLIVREPRSAEVAEKEIYRAGRHGVCSRRGKGSLFPSKPALISNFYGSKGCFMSLLGSGGSTCRAAHAEKGALSTLPQLCYTQQPFNHPGMLLDRKVSGYTQLPSTVTQPSKTQHLDEPNAGTPDGNMTGDGDGHCCACVCSQRQGWDVNDERAGCLQSWCLFLLHLSFESRGKELGAGRAALQGGATRFPAPERLTDWQERPPHPGQEQEPEPAPGAPARAAGGAMLGGRCRRWGRSLSRR